MATDPEAPRDDHTWIVAMVLAIGIATAINLVTFAVLYDAIVSAGPGLSENATQVLTAAFGGIVGVLGAFVGYKAGQIGQNGKRTAATRPVEPRSAPEVGTDSLEPPGAT